MPIRSADVTGGRVVGALAHCHQCWAAAALPTPPPQPLAGRLSLQLRSCMHCRMACSAAILCLQPDVVTRYKAAAKITNGAPGADSRLLIAGGQVQHPPADRPADAIRSCLHAVLKCPAVALLLLSLHAAAFLPLS